MSRICSSRASRSWWKRGRVPTTCDTGAWVGVERPWSRTMPPPPQGDGAGGRANVPPTASAAQRPQRP
jgi:hypothetical protein